MNYYFEWVLSQNIFITKIGVVVWVSWRIFVISNKTQVLVLLVCGRGRSPLRPLPLDPLEAPNSLLLCVHYVLEVPPENEASETLSAISFTDNNDDKFPQQL